jgi:hypothetical protein
VLKEPLKKHMMIRLLRAQASDFIHPKNCFIFTQQNFQLVAVARDYLLFRVAGEGIAGGMGTNLKSALIFNTANVLSCHHFLSK